MIKVKIPGEEVQSGIVILHRQPALYIHIHQADTPAEFADPDRGHAVRSRRSDHGPVDADRTRTLQVKGHPFAAFPPAILCQESGILFYRQPGELPPETRYPRRPLALLLERTALDIISTRET